MSWVRELIIMPGLNTVLNGNTAHFPYISYDSANTPTAQLVMHLKVNPHKEDTLKYTLNTLKFQMCSSHHTLLKVKVIRLTTA
jgi:hypothetical protein